MSYAILRTAKLKTFGNIGGSLAHTYRTIHTPNADPSQTVNNEHDLSDPDLVMAEVKNRLPEKYRSDAVLCIEHLITASPEWHGWGKMRKKSFLNMHENGLTIITALKTLYPVQFTGMKPHPI